jgi:hypothetical protein
MLRKTSIETSINIHRTIWDGGNSHRICVNGVRKTTREQDEGHTVRCEDQDAGSEQKTGIEKRVTVTAEEMPVTTQNKIEGQRILGIEIMFIAQAKPSQGRDKTPEATDPEDLIPEAKTQSNDNSDLSWSA